MAEEQATQAEEIPKEEAPKAEAAPAEEIPKEEAPKAEAAPAEETPKEEAPKAEAPKNEAAKAEEAPKTETSGSAAKKKKINRLSLDELNKKIAEAESASQTQSRYYKHLIQRKKELQPV